MPKKKKNKHAEKRNIKKGEQLAERVMKKLDLREGDVIMHVNCREMIEYLGILKTKILINPQDAYEFVVAYEKVIMNEIATGQTNDYEKAVVNANEETTAT